MARNITITFGDGTTHTYQDAPDNVTPDAVKSRAEQEFGKTVTALDGGRGAAAQPAKPAPSSSIGQSLGNLAAGAVRGAGSIGATLLAPIDVAKDALSGKGLSLESNRQRRAAMDAGLQSLGADPDSMLYQGGKLATEIAGTAGAGGVVGNALSRVAGMAGLGGRAAPLVEAIRTSGMTAPGAGLLTRTAGGVVSGGAQAGLIDPAQAKTGAIVGGALPGAVKIAGAAGRKIGQIARGPEQSADLAAAIGQARGAGYVIPPSQARPTLLNRLLEGASGKITTAQNASAKNAAVTSKLVAQDLGLQADTKITSDVLKGVRDTAGQAYQDIGATGTIAPGPGYAAALDQIEAPFKMAAQGFPNAKQSPVIDIVESLRSPNFDAASAVEKIKELRTAADDAFRTGNTDIGRASRAGAAALEDVIEGHLQSIGQVPLLQQFRDARQLIAKTYSVEKAMNPTTGAIDARALAAQLKRGKPLSGGIKEAAEFAGRFPKAAQTVEGMGSLPQTSPLDWTAAGATSLATGNPLVMLGVGARPLARSVVLSPMVQNRLIQPQGQNALQKLLSNQELQKLVYRTAPAVSAR